MKIALVGVARNEARVVSEWIAYHLELGFDTIIVYDNGSTDTTAEKVVQAGREVDARLLSWGSQKHDWQRSAYDDAVSKFGGEFDWMAFLDIDEFLDCASHGNVKTMVGLLRQNAAICMNWAVFGSNGHKTPAVGLTTEAYTRRGPLYASINQHVKSIVCTRRYMRCVNPHFFEVHGQYVHASGNSPQWISDGIAAAAVGTDVPKVNHFFVKSKLEWQEKVARGYHDGTKRTLDDFMACDLNDEEDLSSMLVGQRALKNYKFLRKEKLKAIWRRRLGRGPSKELVPISF